MSSTSTGSRGDTREGEDPDELIALDVDEDGRLNLPWKLHGYRMSCASRIDRLIYKHMQMGDDNIDLDLYTSFLGGGSILGEGVEKERYVRLDPGLLKAAADFVHAGRPPAGRRRRSGLPRRPDLRARNLTAPPPLDLRWNGRCCLCPTDTFDRGCRRRDREEASVGIEWRTDADAALEEAAERELPALFDFNAAPD